MSEYVCDNTQLKYIVDSIKREANFLHVNTNKISCNGASYLTSSIKKLNNYLTKCNSNLSNIYKYLDKYTKDVDGYEKYAQNINGNMSNNYSVYGKRVWGTTIYTEGEISPFWKMNADVILNADRIVNFNLTYKISDGSSLGQKLFNFQKLDMSFGEKAYWATVECSFGIVSALFDEVEAIIDTGLYAVGGVAYLIGDEDTSDWCKEAIALDTSECFMEENFYEPSLIYEYADPHSTAAQVSNVAGTILVGIVMNDAITGAAGIVAEGAKLSTTSAKMLTTVSNGVYDAVQAFGGGVEKAFSNDATYGEAGLAGLTRAAIGAAKGGLEGGYAFKVGNEVTSIGTKIGEGLLRTGYSITTPIYNELADTIIYQNDGIDSLNDLVTTFGENAEADNLSRQILIAAGTTGITCIKNGVKNQLYENNFAKTGIVSDGDNFLKYIDSINENPDTFYSKNKSYFDKLKMNKTDYLKAAIQKNVTSNIANSKLTESLKKSEYNILDSDNVQKNLEEYKNKYGKKAYNDLKENLEKFNKRFSFTNENAEILENLFFSDEEIMIGTHASGTTHGNVLMDNGLKLTGHSSHGVMEQDNYNVSLNVSLTDNSNKNLYHYMKLFEAVAGASTYKTLYNEGDSVILAMPKSLVNNQGDVLNKNSDLVLKNDNGETFINPKYILGEYHVNDTLPTQFTKNENYGKDYDLSMQKSYDLHDKLQLLSAYKDYSDEGDTEYLNKYNDLKNDIKKYGLTDIELDNIKSYEDELIFSRTKKYDNESAVEFIKNRFEDNSKSRQLYSDESNNNISNRINEVSNLSNDDVIKIRSSIAGLENARVFSENVEEIKKGFCSAFSLDYDNDIFDRKMVNSILDIIESDKFVDDSVRTIFQNIDNVKQFDPYLKIGFDSNMGSMYWRPMHVIVMNTNDISSSKTVLTHELGHSLLHLVYGDANKFYDIELTQDQTSALLASRKNLENNSSKASDLILKIEKADDSCFYGIRDWYNTYEKANENIKIQNMVDDLYASENKDELKLKVDSAKKIYQISETLKQAGMSELDIDDLLNNKEMVTQILQQQNNISNINYFYHYNSASYDSFGDLRKISSMVDSLSKSGYSNVPFGHSSDYWEKHGGDLISYDELFADYVSLSSNGRIDTIRQLEGLFGTEVFDSIRYTLDDIAQKLGGSNG